MWLKLTPAGIFERDQIPRLYNMHYVKLILKMNNMKGSFLIYDNDEEWKIVQETTEEIEEMLKTK